MTDDTRALSNMPAMSITESVNRYNALVEFVQRIMRQDVDYGVIPGTTKPTLLKPGAEKLCTLFGLSSRFLIVNQMLEWGDAEHEPLFMFNYKCQLSRGDVLIAEGDGSCNSRERKYRYRDQQRVCPNCHKATIIKGKQEYGGGWVCFVKRGGCGWKFKDDDTIITSQQVGQILNPDIADQVNTIQKMAQKRALIAATLIAVNASEFFTQDMEDLTIEGEYTTASVRDDKPALEPEAKPGAEPTPTPAAASAPPPQPAKPRKLAMVKGSADKAFRTAADEWAQQYPRYLGADGHADYNHILASALLEGYAEITVENIRAVLDQVGQRHTIETLAEEAA